MLIYSLLVVEQPANYEYEDALDVGVFSEPEESDKFPTSEFYEDHE